MRTGFRDRKGYGVTKHHDKRSVAFDEGAFHEAVFDEVSEILVYVKAHVYGCEGDAEGGFDFGGSDDDVFVYGYTAVFPCEAVYANDVAVLVFAVRWPSNRAGGAFVDDFNNVACAYAKFLHSSLVDAGDASADISLSCVSDA